MRDLHDPHFDPCAVNSLIETPGCDPAAGRVVWDPLHSLWNGGMMAAALVLGPSTFSGSALVVTIFLAWITLMAGLSVGLHRGLAHGAFACSAWTMRILAWLGVLVGLGGPIGMVTAHHLSDWAQHRPAAHPFFTHRRGALTHLVWRMHGRIELERPKTFDLARLERDPVLRFLERTWMLQQIPLALILYAIGGWSMVVWGVAVRIAVSTTVYWTIAHLAHSPGKGDSHPGTPGNDVAWAGLISMGEAWHNNHHAYPGSARIGLHPGQSDWGWRFIQMLERVGLAWDVRTPETMGDRPLERATP